MLDQYKINFNTLGFEAMVFRNDRASGYTKYVMLFEESAKAHVIAHEALHIVTYLFQDRNIRIENNNDEPAAYLLGWIVGECHKFLNVK